MRALRIGIATLFAGAAAGAIALASRADVATPSLPETTATQPPAASAPLPTAAPAERVTSASPSPAPLRLDAARGLVVDLGGHGIGVRTETSANLIFRVDNRTQFAVSAKGQLAYWKTGEDDALPHELHVFDFATR